MLDTAYLDAMERGIAPGSRQTFSEEEMRRLIGLVREQGRQIAEYELLRTVVVRKYGLNEATRPAKVARAVESGAEGG